MIAAISSACVHEVVSRAFRHPVASSSNAWHRRVYGPSPAMWPFTKASFTYSCSWPTIVARLNGILKLDIPALLVPRPLV